MSYAFAGKIAGYGRDLRGLGDAAYDSALQAYNVDHAQWVLDKQAYDQAYAAWQAQSSQTLAAYNQALAAYNANLASWQAQQAAYTGQQNQARTNQMTVQMTYGSMQNAATAQYPAIVIPAGYAGCVTQAQHDAWAKTCSFLSVKGLGGPTPTGPECGLAMLPVCAPTPAALPPPGPRPVPPPLPNPPLAPPPVRPEPQPPAQPPPPPPPRNQPSPPPSVLTPSYTVPDSLPVPPPSTTPTNQTTSAGLLSNGLLLVILAGGGYALYRTFKKPKKAA